MKLTGLIKTITKFLNVIGYQQPDLKINRTVCVSCLWLDSVIGHLTGHAYVCGQYASPACAVVRHFTELTAVFVWKCVTDV